MRTIRSMEEARRYLGRPRMLDPDAVPPGAEEQTRSLFGEPLAPQEVVRRILHDVQEQGDAALTRYTQLLDGAAPATFEVPEDAFARAQREAPPELVRALEVAAERVRAFHQATLPKSWVDPDQGYGERFTPIERVGIYIPGGTAVYPSTALMTAIPARVAGVPQVIVATPTHTANAPDPGVLVACRLAGVDQVFQIGGAQAIAALAFGTQSIPKVDMICGPGNLYVTLAKKQVYGEVAIDGLYGPTETVIIADGQADPGLCAADLLAQAEHDPLATPILITTDPELMPRVEKALEGLLGALERSAIARTALDNQGCLVAVGILDEAFELANLFAPEHLCLMLQEPWAHLDKVRNAGGVFLGPTTPEVLGDYVAGPSHVMPTGGTARFSSPLGVHQFLKVTSVVGFNRARLLELASTTSTIARHEGFTAHARAVERRLEGG